MPAPPTPLADVGALFDVLAEGAGWFGPADDPEPIDLLAHSLQCADRLAAGAPDDVGLHLAGLVHDVGHLSTAADPAGGHDHHERHGARMVADLLGERVGRLVALHVEAKRYLAAVDPHRAETLSGGSIASLSGQGGAMTDDERVAFEAEPLARTAVELRLADDEAKEPGRPTSGLDHWRRIAIDWNATRARRVD